MTKSPSDDVDGEGFNDNDKWALLNSELLRTVSANDLHVVMSQFLSAAKDIHIAMCRFDDNHAAQSVLNSALQSALIGAEQCRKLHAAPKRRVLT